MHRGKTGDLSAITSGRRNDRFEFWGDAQIERRPRGASRAALAPTFVSGQLFLCHLRANALAHGAISRCTNKAVARACHRRYWPETNVGASKARDAPRGRRSICAQTQNPRQTPRPNINLPPVPHRPGGSCRTCAFSRPGWYGEYANVQPRAQRYRWHRPGPAGSAPAPGYPGNP